MHIYIHIYIYTHPCILVNKSCVFLANMRTCNLVRQEHMYCAPRETTHSVCIYIYIYMHIHIHTYLPTYIIKYVYMYIHIDNIMAFI